MNPARLGLQICMTWGLSSSSENRLQTDQSLRSALADLLSMSGWPQSEGLRMCIIQQ